MASKAEKKIVYRATLSDETVAKLSAMTVRFKALTKPLDDMTAKFKQMNYAIAPITKKLEKIGKSMSKIGKFGMKVITAPIIAGAAFGVKTAGDVEAEKNKLVFAGP